MVEGEIWRGLQNDSRWPRRWLESLTAEEAKELERLEENRWLRRVDSPAEYAAVAGIGEGAEW